ncbi:MAG: protein-export chaperone SecB [Roseburia sp.]
MKASSFQFTDPSLVHIKFEENKKFQHEEENDIPINVSINVEKEELSENEAIVKTSVVVGAESEKVPFVLEAVASARFKWDAEKINKDTSSIFLKQNAPALLISYLRPIIAMITNASHYPAYNLPFISFVDD